jgi:nitrogen fixation NifU-like protein
VLILSNLAGVKRTQILGSRGTRFWPDVLRFQRAVAILLRMFTEAVLDHFSNPRNAGELADADATVEVSNPVCGDVLQLAVRLENGRIAEVRFLCRGCTTAIACGSLLTEKLMNRTVRQAGDLSPVAIAEALGGLPAATFHGAQLASAAAHALAEKFSTAGR